MLTPDAIQKKEFEQSVLGGYRRDEVDSFLDQVEENYRKLYNENNELLEKLKACLAKIDVYQKDEEFLKNAIINAQKLNETTLREIELREKEVEVTSKAKAAEIIAEAEGKAEEMLQKAERESADAIQAARERCKNEIEIEQKNAEAEIAKIQGEVAAEQMKLDHLRAQVAEFKNTIIDIYKAHLTSISKLPDFKPEEAAPAPKKEEAAPIEEAPAVEEKNIEEEPIAEPIPEEESPKAEGITVEFKLDEKEEKEDKIEEPVVKAPKFENLKFGVDYDINKDN